jgi:glycosyltransferase involved in cell wall biosynthesis
MKKVIDVDILCANYNNSSFLDQFFQSVINNTVMPNSLIFVDDGSTDDSLSIAYNYLDSISFLKIIELNTNKGFGNALNEGIAISTAKYIARIDPDDMFTPQRLEIQYNILENTDATVVGSNAIIFHSDTNQQLSLSNFPVEHDAIAKRIRKGEHGVLHPTVMALSSLFKNNLYIQENVPAEDYDIFARFLLSGARFFNVKEPLVRYRVHAKSASNILPYNTIRKTFKIRDSLFHTKTNFISVFLYYLHIKNYRKLLFETNPAKRFFYVFISSIVYPSKFFSRFKRMIGFGI